MCSPEVFARAVTDMLFVNTYVATSTAHESETRTATPLTSPSTRCVPSLDDMISWTPIPSASETAKLFSLEKNLATAVTVPSVPARMGKFTPVKAASIRTIGQTSMPRKRKEQHGHANSAGNIIYRNHFEGSGNALGSIFEGFERVVAVQYQGGSKKNMRENLGERTPPSLRKKNAKLILGGLNTIRLGGEGSSSNTSGIGRQRRLSITSVASSATVGSGKNLKVSKKTIAKDKKMMVVTAAADALRMSKMHEFTVDSDTVPTGSDDSSLVCLKKKVTRISNLMTRRRKPKQNEDVEIQDSSETADRASKVNMLLEPYCSETCTRALEVFKTPVSIIGAEKGGDSFANAFLDVLGETATTIFGESDQGPTSTSENSNTLAVLTSGPCDDEVMQYVMMMIGTKSSSSDTPADRVDSANFLERRPLAKLQSSSISSSSSSSSSESHAWTDLIKFDLGDECNSVPGDPSSSASTVDDMFFDSIMSNSDDMPFLNDIDNRLDMLGWNASGGGLSSVMLSPLKFNTNFIPDFIGSQCDTFSSFTMGTDVLMTNFTCIEEDKDENNEEQDIIEGTESLNLKSELASAKKPKKGGRKPSGDIHYECLHPGCDKKYASKTGFKYHLGVHKRDKK
ncbi:hypothetical protein HK100_011375, partial [Physocladia obscura]